jgi:hypothetical protein
MSDTSLFIFYRGSKTVYLLLYVDDIVLTTSSTKLSQRTISALQREFSMKDLEATSSLPKHLRPASAYQLFPMSMIVHDGDH